MTTGSMSSEEKWERRLLLGATVLAVVGVAGIAAAISYGHMHDWASANGEPSWRALLFPLSVDGLLIAASVVLLADSRSGRQADWLAYLLAGVGASVSVAANVAHDWTGPIAATAIAGWPPLALLGSYELLMRLLRRLRRPAAQATQTAADPVAPATPTRQTATAPTTAAKTPAPHARKPRPASRTQRPGTGSTAQAKAFEWWRAERAAGRNPTGKDVARVGGVDDSLGRRWIRSWLKQETTNDNAATAVDEIASETAEERAA